MTHVVFVQTKVKRMFELGGLILPRKRAFFECPFVFEQDFWNLNDKKKLNIEWTCLDFGLELVFEDLISCKTMYSFLYSCKTLE